MSSPKSQLKVHQLEDRSLMSATALGSPWPDASALSLSFAPDDTAFGVQKSSLFGALKNAADQDDWQREVLRAFQAWAVHANINVAVTPDSGDAFGTPGDSQGDTRFGDVRIGAARLAADSLANVSPFDWSIGTWSGDLLLNTASKFSVGSRTVTGANDLFSVILHEAGHVFGLDHSSESSSALTAQYGGRKTGPSPQDIANLQAIYGTRQPDAFEGVTGNDTAATAAALAGDASYAAVADVGSRADVDFFAVTVPAGADKFSIRLRTAGLSSLVPSLTVYDATGAVVGSQTRRDPLDAKDLEIKANGKAGGRYTVRVSGATADDFAIGRYELRANFNKEEKPGTPTFVQDGGDDDTVVTATELLPGRQTGWRIRGNGFAQNAAIESAADIDYYRLTTPAIGSGTADALTVQVRGLSNKGSLAAPAVTVFDAAGLPVPARILDNDGPSVTLQIPGIARGATYYIRVANSAVAKATTGNYRLTAVIGPVAEKGMHVVQAGTLSGAAATQSQELQVVNGRLFQFALTTVGTVGDQLRVSIVTDTGRQLFALTQDANVRPQSSQVYLPTGRYRLIVTQIRGAGTTRYWLQAGVYNDPIGPYAPQVDSSPTAPMSPSPPMLTPFTSDAQLFTDTSGYWYVPFTSFDSYGYYSEI